MKNNLNYESLRTTYTTINYVIISYKSGVRRYIEFCDNRIKQTYLLNKAMKFYNYNDALSFANKHHLKKFKIRTVQFTTKLIEEI